MFVSDFHSNRDRLLRVIAVNKQLSSLGELNVYLTKQEQSLPISGKMFEKVTYRDMVQRSTSLDIEYNQLYTKTLKRDIFGILDTNEKSMTVIVISLITINKIFKLSFPWFIILYYCVYNNETERINYYQWASLYIYIILTIIVWITSPHIIKMYHALWHIYPINHKKFQPKTEEKSFKLVQNIHDYYHRILYIESRLAILMNKFGDIGYIINEYCIQFREYVSPYSKYIDYF